MSKLYTVKKETLTYRLLQPRQYPQCFLDLLQVFRPHTEEEKKQKGRWIIFKSNITHM